MGRLENIENEKSPIDTESVMQQIEWDINDSSIMESSESWANKSQISKFYAGKHIFITGATGFMGLALIEKLLRACPDIAALYLLIRSKRGKTVQERIDSLFDNIIFENLHKKYGKNFYKCVVPIIGDAGEENLGISDEDANMITSKLDMIFHVAANVRFNEPLTTMVKVNIRAIKYAIDLGKRCPNLKAFVHVSTAYSNCRESVIEEKFYKPEIDPHKLITIVEKGNKNELSLLTKKLIHEYPNTYTFCKQIGEDLIRDCGLPSCVFRPAIVTTTYEEPIAGWTQNLAGPAGLMIGVGMGVIRLVLNNVNNVLEMIPCDYSINAIIACGWQVANKQSIKNPKPIVYNNVSSASNAIYWSKFRDICTKLVEHTPHSQTIWYIEIYFLTNQFFYWFWFILLHLIPGCIIDGLLYMKNQPTRVLEGCRKLYQNNDLLTYFTLHQFTFHEDNLRSVLKDMTNADALAFQMDVKTIDWHEYLRRMILGIRTYTLKDDIENIPYAKNRLKKLKIIHFAIKETILLYVLYYLCTKLINFVMTRYTL